MFQEFSNQNNNNNANSLTVSWINNTAINNNNNNDNSILSSLDNFYSSENLNSHLRTNNTNNNNIDGDINIDHLLEIELTANQQSPIDKYIDLDDIDVNPLDCYRNTNNNNHHHHNSGNNGGGGLHNTSNANLDEFALQFSVCSSSSSGFSEPSSFSCSSSSMSSTNSGMNAFCF